MKVLDTNAKKYLTFHTYILMDFGIARELMDTERSEKRRSTLLPSQRAQSKLAEKQGNVATLSTDSDGYKTGRAYIHETPHLRHVPGLDGLRGLSVISVMCFHAAIVGASGLYMGVDGFFVLSGYLITSLLIGDITKNGSVSFGSFWSRRARRLLPALFVMMFVVLFVEVGWGDKAQFASIRGDAIAALAYVSNWYYIWTHTGYFGQGQAVSPLQHTWSLAIEEQFYVVWPLLVAAVLKLRKSLKSMFMLSLVGSILSAILMAIVYGNGSGLNAAYYGTDTRAQALLIGCALAFLLNKKEVVNNPKFVNVVAALGPIAFGVVAIIWAFAGGPPSWMFHGGFFISDVGVAIVIASATLAPRRLFSQALSVAPLRYMGKISYGLYLWHFPIFIVINEARTGFSGAALFAIRFGITVLVAVVSYYVIEQPIRIGSFLKNRWSWIATAISVTLILVFSVVVGSISPSSASVVLPTGANTIAASLKLNPLRVLLVGDSVAVTLGWGASIAAPSYGIKLNDDAAIGCGVLQGGLINQAGQIGYQGGSEGYCANIYQKYPSEVSSFNPDISLVLAGRWECLDRNWGNGWEHIGESDFDKRLIASLNQEIGVLSKNGALVVLLTSPYFNIINQNTGIPYPESDPSRVNDYNSILREVAAASKGKAVVLNLNGDVSPHGQYAEYIDNVQIRWTDGVHITEPQGGEWISKWMMPKLVNLGVAHRSENG